MYSLSPDQFLTRILVFILAIALYKNNEFIFATFSTENKFHYIKEHSEKFSKNLRLANPFELHLIFFPVLLGQLKEQL